MNFGFSISSALNRAVPAKSGPLLDLRLLDSDSIEFKSFCNFCFWVVTAELSSTPCEDIGDKDLSLSDNVLFSSD